MLNFDRISLFFVGLIFFFTPFESFALVESFSVVKISFLMALGIFVIYLINRKYFRSHWVYYLFIPYIVLVGASFLWSVSPAKTFSNFVFTVLPSALLSFVVFNIVRSSKDIVYCLRAYGLAAGIISIYMSMGTFLGLTAVQVVERDTTGRVTVLGQDANELAMLLLFGLAAILVIKFYFKEQVLLKNNLLDFFVFICLFLSLLSAVFATGSRTGFVVAVFVVFMSSFLLNVRKQIPVVLLCSILLVSVFFFISPELGDRLLQLNLVDSRGGSGRTSIWAGVLQYWGGGQNQIAGFGFSTFEDVALRAINSAKAGHNTYIIILVELGVLGLLAYLLKVLPVFFLAMLRSKYILILSLVILAPYLIGSLTLGLESRRWFFIFQPLIMSLIVEWGDKSKGIAVDTVS